MNPSDFEGQARREWDAFVAAHPDAEELRMNGTLRWIGETLNRGLPEEQQRWGVEMIYGLAQVEADKSGRFERIISLVRIGHSLKEAAEIAEKEYREDVGGAGR